MQALTYTAIRGRPCRIMWSQRDPGMRRSGAWNLYVRNIPLDTSARDLWDSFKFFGNVLSVKLPTADGKSLGYGYVQYDNEASAKSAKEELGGVEWPEGSGKVLLIEHFVKRTERLRGKEWTNVFVRNMPAAWDETALAGAFHTGVRIVPGLRGPGLIGPDVMRGEETQILGWLAADPARLSGVHTLCLPGTHAKWVRVEEGRLIRFVTAMTGELYDLLGAQSVLRFAGPPGPIDLAAFDAGVAAAADGGALAARLFGLRGLTLNGGLAAEAAPSWLSGLLIGAEIAALQPGFATRTGAAVHLIGATRLCGLYARALAAKDVSCEIADGEEAVLAGLTRIWSAIA
jgi:2-keto-3-deoxy-galactonokinase